MGKGSPAQARRVYVRDGKMSVEEIPHSRDSRIDSMLRQLEHGVAFMEKQTAAYREKWSEVEPSLLEAAKGLWCEKTVTTKKGEERVKVYQRAPDIRAVEVIVRLLGPDIPARVLNSYVVAENNWQHIVAKTALAKAKHLESQARLNSGNATVFEKHLIEEETITDAITQFISGFMGLLQSTPVEQMREEYCKDEKSYQRWQEMIAEAINKQAEKIFSETLPNADDSDEDDDL